MDKKVTRSSFALHFHHSKCQKVVIEDFSQNLRLFTEKTLSQAFNFHWSIQFDESNPQVISGIFANQTAEDFLTLKIAMSLKSLNKSLNFKVQNLPNYLDNNLKVSAHIYCFTGKNQKITFYLHKKVSVNN